LTFEKRHILYEMINKIPGLTIHELSRKINLSMRKVNRYVKKLVKDEIVEGKYFPTPMRELINWDEMKYTNTPE